VVAYTRRDGTPSALLGWESQCVDCGVAFGFKTPNSEWFNPNRRCQTHRKPGIVASAQNDVADQSEQEIAAARALIAESPENTDSQRTRGG
jgi:hypothetical protein